MSDNQNGFQLSSTKGLNSLAIPAWSQLGAEVNALTWEEAMTQANLNWTVSKEQQRSVRPNAAGEYPLIDSYGIYRDDNNAFLGHVGSIFTPIQNIDQFQFVDNLIENIGGAHYVAAGSLDGGEQVFCVAEVDAFDVASSGDKHRAFVTFRDFKNSKGSGEGRVSLLREVCTNGLHRRVAEKVLRFRHTTNVKSRMEQAAASIGLINSSFNEIREKLETLSTRRFPNERSIEEVLSKIFPPTPEEVRSNRVNNRRKESMLVVAELLAANDGNAFPEQAGTAYALFNAVTNYVDHERPVRARDGQSEEDSRAVSSLFGTGSDFKSGTLDLILRETENLPTYKPVYSFGGGAAGTQVLEIENEQAAPKSLLDEILDNPGSINPGLN